MPEQREGPGVQRQEGVEIANRHAVRNVEGRGGGQRSGEFRNRPGFEERGIQYLGPGQGFIRSAIRGDQSARIGTLAGGPSPRAPGLEPGPAESSRIRDQPARGQMAGVVPDAVGIDENQLLGRPGFEGQAQGLADG